MVAMSCHVPGTGLRIRRNRLPAGASLSPSILSKLSRDFMYQIEDDVANALKSSRRERRRFRFPMIPIRSLANVYGRIAYAIGPERWIPRVTQRVLCSVRTTEKKIALTFDDGPNPEYTPLLLTKLASIGFRRLSF
jgi:hypothetical protein